MFWLRPRGGFYLDMNFLSDKIVAFAFRAAPQMAGSRAEGWEHHIRQHPQFTEQADLLRNAEVGREWAQRRAHVVNDPFDRDCRIAAFDANGVKDFVGDERQKLFVVAAGGDIEPYLSAFQDSYLKALQVRRQVLRSNINGQQQVQSSVV